MAEIVLDGGSSPEVISILDSDNESPSSGPEGSSGEGAGAVTVSSSGEEDLEEFVFGGMVDLTASSTSLIQNAVSRMAVMFPDACPDYMFRELEKLSLNEGLQAEEGVAALSMAMVSKSYPRLSAARKKREKDEAFQTRRKFGCVFVLFCGLLSNDLRLNEPG